MNSEWPEAQSLKSSIGSDGLTFEEYFPTKQQKPYDKLLRHQTALLGHFDPEYFFRNVANEIKYKFENKLRKHRLVLEEERQEPGYLTITVGVEKYPMHKKLFCNHEERYMLRDRRKEHFIKGRNEATSSLITSEPQDDESSEKKHSV